MLGGFGKGEEGKRASEDGGNRKALLAGSASSESDSRGSGARPGRASRSGGKGDSLRTPVSAEDLMAYLKILESVDDFEEVNFMQLLRQGSYVTRMSEREVTDLLTQFAKEDEENGVEGGDGELTQIFTGLLFTRLMELNGPDAMKMLMAGEMGPRWKNEKDELLAVGMASWVDADPEGAINWFRGEAMSDPNYRELFEDNTVQRAFFAAMSRHDPREAMSLAQEAGGEVSSDNMEVIARHENSVEGLERMLAATNGETQFEVFQVMSNRDPQAAARWLAGAGAVEERDHFVETVASGMMERDTERGVEWYISQEITTDEGRSERLERVVGQLAEENPATASTWLEGQPDTLLREEAEENMARFATRNSDWETSFRWAAELSDEGQRLETVNWILRRGWDRREQTMNPQMREAAENAGFGEEVGAYLENTLK